MKNNFKLIKNDNPNIGRCVYCEAKPFCGRLRQFKCNADITQHYISIKTERKYKLLNLIKIV